MLACVQRITAGRAFLHRRVSVEKPSGSRVLRSEVQRRLIREAEEKVDLVWREGVAARLA